MEDAAVITAGLLPGRQDESDHRRLENPDSDKSRFALDSRPDSLPSRAKAGAGITSGGHVNVPYGLARFVHQRLKITQQERRLRFGRESFRPLSFRLERFLI